MTSRFSPGASVRLALALVVASSMAGCAGVDVAGYAAERPQLDLRRYFDGPIDAWGLVHDRSGKVIRRFHVAIDARWRGDTGTLDESFTYADGRREKRVWTVVKDGDRYTATAADVVGTAIGAAAGNALNLRYVLAVPIDGATWNLDMDDWMFQMDEATLLNRTRMSKFGIPLGDITIAFRKR
jgi:hypothetical protein